MPEGFAGIAWFADMAGSGDTAGIGYNWDSSDNKPQGWQYRKALLPEEAVGGY